MDSPLLFKSGNGADSPGKFVRPDGCHQLPDPKGHFFLRTVAGVEINAAVSVLAILSNQRRGKKQRGQRTLAQRAGNLQKGSGSGAQLAFGKIYMACGSRGLPQHIFDGAADPAVTVRRDSQGNADPVGRPETDPFQIVTQPIGIPADNFRGLIPVKPADADRQRGGNAVGLEEDHGLPGTLLFLVAGGDHDHALRADAGNFRQPFRMLGKDSQGFLTEMAHDERCSGGTDAADQTAAEVPFDAQQRGRGPDFTGNAFELAAVGPVLRPFAGEDSLLSRTQLRQGADDGEFISPGPDGQHRPAVFRITENSSENSGFQLFHRCPPCTNLIAETTAIMP